MEFVEKESVLKNVKVTTQGKSLAILLPIEIAQEQGLGKDCIIDQIIIKSKFLVLTEVEKNILKTIKQNSIYTESEIGVGMYLYGLREALNLSDEDIRKFYKFGKVADKYLKIVNRISDYPAFKVSADPSNIEEYIIKPFFKQYQKQDARLYLWCVLSLIQGIKIGTKKYYRGALKEWVESLPFTKEQKEIVLNIHKELREYNTNQLESQRDQILLTIAGTDE